MNAVAVPEPAGLSVAFGGVTTWPDSGEGARLKHHAQRDRIHAGLSRSLCISSKPAISDSTPSQARTVRA